MDKWWRHSSMRTLSMKNMTNSDKRKARNELSRERKLLSQQLVEEARRRWVEKCGGAGRSAVDDICATVCALLPGFSA